MFLQDNNPHDLKYIQELSTEITNYLGQVILNVFNGVAANLGFGNPDKLASKPPVQKSFHHQERGCCEYHDTLLLKGFLSGMRNLGQRLKGLVGRKIKKAPKNTPFTVKGLKLYKKDGEPMTSEQWREFETQIDDYMRPFVDGLAEEISVKGMLLAMAANEAEQQGKSINQYGKKSYAQIEREAFSGYVPDTLLSAEERYDLDDSVKNAMQLSIAQIGENIQGIPDNLRQAIKEQVIAAHRTGKPAQELASDLYWSHVDKPELQKYTAHIIMKDMQRIAVTELASAHEKGKLSGYEEMARKSVDDPEQAIYFVFNGSGKCDWCKDKLGTIVRLIPLEQVGNERDDSLKSRGISDPHTDIAVWVGKSNVGFTKANWRVCTPVHPWCGDSLSRIHPDSQTYDKETGRIKYKKGEEFEKFIPTDFIGALENERAKYRERQDVLTRQRAETTRKKR